METTERPFALAASDFLPPQYKKQTSDLLAYITGENPSWASKFKPMALRKGDFFKETIGFLQETLPDDIDLRYVFFDAMFTAYDLVCQDRPNKTGMTIAQTQTANDIWQGKAARAGEMMEAVINRLPADTKANQTSLKEEVMRAYCVHRLRQEKPVGATPDFIQRELIKYGRRYEYLLTIAGGEAEIGEQQLYEIVLFLGQIPEQRRESVKFATTARRIKPDILIALGNNKRYTVALLGMMKRYPNMKEICSHAKDLIKALPENVTSQPALLSAQLAQAEKKIPFVFVNRLKGQEHTKAAVSALLAELPLQDLTGYTIDFAEGREMVGAKEAHTNLFEALTDFSQTPSSEIKKQIEFLKISIRDYLNNWRESVGTMPHLETEYLLIRGQIFNRLPSRIPPELFEEVFEEIRAGDSTWKSEIVLVSALTHNTDFAKRYGVTLCALVGNEAVAGKMAEAIATHRHDPFFIPSLFLNEVGAAALTSLMRKEGVSEAVFEQRGNEGMARSLGRIESDEYPEIKAGILVGVIKGFQEQDKKTDPPGNRADEFLKAVYPSMNMANSALERIVEYLTTDRNYREEDGEAVIAIYNRGRDINPRVTRTSINLYEHARFAERVLIGYIGEGDALFTGSIPDESFMQSLAGILLYEGSAEARFTAFWKKVQDQRNLDLRTVRRNIGRIFIAGVSQRESVDPDSLYRVCRITGLIGAQGETGEETVAILRKALGKAISESSWTGFLLRIRNGADLHHPIFSSAVEAFLMRDHFSYFSGSIWRKDSDPEYDPRIWRDFALNTLPNQDLMEIAERIVNGGLPVSGIRHLNAFLNQLGEERARQIIKLIKDTNSGLITQHIQRYSFQDSEAGLELSALLAKLSS